MAEALLFHWGGAQRLIDTQVCPIGTHDAFEILSTANLGYAPFMRHSENRPVRAGGVMGRVMGGKRSGGKACKQGSGEQRCCSEIHTGCISNQFVLP